MYSRFFILPFRLRRTVAIRSGLSLFWDKPFEELYKNVDQTPEYERQREVSFPRHAGYLSASS